MRVWGEIELRSSKRRFLTTGPAGAAGDLYEFTQIHLQHCQRLSRALPRQGEVCVAEASNLDCAMGRDLAPPRERGYDFWSITSGDMIL